MRIRLRPMTGILDVDLLAFEQGGSSDRAATVDGVMQSLRTGFVYTKHDISEGLLDEAYEVLEKFFDLPTQAKEDYFAQGSKGQSGYTGLLVETAAVSDTPDWKEMFNWGFGTPLGSPSQRPLSPQVRGAYFSVGPNPRR